MSEDCRDCGEDLESISTNGGGLLGFMCWNCETFYALESLDISRIKLNEVRDIEA